MEYEKWNMEYDGKENIQNIRIIGKKARFASLPVLTKRVQLVKTIALVHSHYFYGIKKSLRPKRNLFKPQNETQKLVY